MTVVVTKPERSLGCGTGVLGHHGPDTFLPATLTRGGAGQDGRGPDHSGAALPGRRHSVHALHVLIAQLSLRRVEISVTAGTAGGGLRLLQLRPLSALNNTRSVNWLFKMSSALHHIYDLDLHDILCLCMRLSDR